MSTSYDPNFPIEKVIKILDKKSETWDVPVVTLIALQNKDPFKVLLSTIISLRTKDEVTIEASKRLYELLLKPSDIYSVSLYDVESAIYPCGFYKKKAVQIDKICRELAENFNNKVPYNLDTLLKFDGIGRKTANLVLSEGFGIPAMCVDVHVHRISNRLGYISTNNPEETEYVLRDILPKEFWNRYNSLLVAFGQNTCRPVSPFCSKCPVSEFCKKKGVLKSR